LLQKERYEVVTPEELAAIKQAMVSGPAGIATHSGHWYNCVNGHPVRISLVSLKSSDVCLSLQLPVSLMRAPILFIHLGSLSIACDFSPNHSKHGS
jgi:hypothetical protein